MREVAKYAGFSKAGSNRMYYILFGGIATDPAQALNEKLTQWCGIWKCKDAEARTRACRVIRKAIATALQASDYDEGAADLFAGSQLAAAAGSFRANTSVGSDNWPLREYAMVAKEELDRFGQEADCWKKKCITPMPYLFNIMSMIPKKENGFFA